MLAPLQAKIPSKSTLCASLSRSLIPEGLRCPYKVEDTFQAYMCAVTDQPRMYSVSWGADWAKSTPFHRL